MRPEREQEKQALGRNLGLAAPLPGGGAANASLTSWPPGQPGSAWAQLPGAAPSKARETLPSRWAKRCCRHRRAGDSRGMPASRACFSSLSPW